MILLIDIGNTRTKIALGKKTNTKISFIKAISTKSNNWENELKIIFLNIKTEIEHGIISSVVPEKLELIKKIINLIFNFQPIIIDNNLIKQLPLNIKINEKKIGNDLITLAIAGAYKYGNSVIISLGTATTYTIINNNSLKGIIIAPGFTSSKMSLIQDAALIKDFKINKYQSVLATSTKHALSIGYGNGFNYMIQGIIKAINKELKTNLKIIITGGSYQELKPFLKFKYQYHDNLVLQGLIIIYQIWKKK